VTGTGLPASRERVSREAWQYHATEIQRHRRLAGPVFRAEEPSGADVHHGGGERQQKPQGELGAGPPRGRRAGGPRPRPGRCSGRLFGQYPLFALSPLPPPPPPRFFHPLLHYTRGRLGCVLGGVFGGFFVGGWVDLD
jgi:hypothetical protein